jgi:hypothetical protein
MKLKMIKPGPIAGKMKTPGDVIEVDDGLGRDLISFGYAREYKERPRTAEKKAPGRKTASKRAPRTAEKVVPERETAERFKSEFGSEE